MNYYKYYLEIKNRIILLFVTWLFTLFMCYLYKEVLLFFILNSTHFFQSTFENQREYNYFIFTDVTEVFYVYIDLVLFMPSGTPSVISAINRGSPAARTYTSSGGNLQLAMASGTYNVANSNIEQAC